MRGGQALKEIYLGDLWMSRDKNTLLPGEDKGSRVTGSGLNSCSYGRLL